MARILQKAGIDFTILGGRNGAAVFRWWERVCPKSLEEMKAHNLQKVAEVGAKTVVFTCPSCFHTWQHFYDTDLKLLHSSQLMAELIHSGKLKLNGKDQLQ
jgi:heterodisulfide reductase subunit D